jgi:hypothetical protein
VAAVLVAVLAGCTSIDNMLGSSDTSAPAPVESGPAAPPQPSSGTIPPKDSLTNMILGKPAAGPAPADNVFKPDDNLPCPEVTVRPGTATLQIGSKGATGEVPAMELRYQGSLVRFSRECKYSPTLVTMKLGIEGRVIVGPVGGPGQIEVPVRFAVVEEGPNPKTVLSKLARIPVTIGSDPTVEFTHIDPDIAFPMPRSVTALDRYVVYVGFDPTALAQPKHRPVSRRKR